MIYLNTDFKLSISGPRRKGQGHQKKKYEIKISWSGGLVVKLFNRPLRGLGFESCSSPKKKMLMHASWGCDKYTGILS